MEAVAPDIAPALEELPLFPLPHVVLLPGALMPLHIFETRYRTMVRDALAGHRALGIVQIADPDKRDENGQPIIARVAGVGTIVDHAELPSGRFNIVLRGRVRVELAELPFVPPYRRAKATVLHSHEESLPSTAIAALIATATTFVGLVRQRDKSFDFRMPKLSDAGSLVDHCAQHLLIDARDRQRALETTSVAERVRQVTETLALQHMGLSGGSKGLN
jgi:Lon protease-like protein